ncbi:MAG TPA: hypothetical protein VGG71_10425, partial [Chitinophagaceae bacterium]
IISKIYDDMPSSNQSKAELTFSFSDYLSKLNNEQKIKEGIDMIVKFKNAVPRSDRGLTDPMINAGLQKIAAAKGGDIQAYATNAIKQ